MTGSNDAVLTIIARDNASEAFRRVSIAAGVAARRMQDSMAKIAEAGRTFSDLIMRYFRRPPVPDPPPIPLHGFTPNFDLVCAVCHVGPEECRGGRA